MRCKPHPSLQEIQESSEAFKRWACPLKLARGLDGIFGSEAKTMQSWSEIYDGLCSWHVSGRLDGCNSRYSAIFQALRLGEGLSASGTDGSEHVHLRSPSAAPVHHQMHKAISHGTTTVRHIVTGTIGAGSAPLAWLDV